MLCSLTEITLFLHKCYTNSLNSYILLTQQLHNILQQLEAEGHLLGMVVTMKGYTAIIVDIIGFLSKKEEIPKQQTPLLSRIYHKKLENKSGEYAVGQLCHNCSMAT